MKNNLIIRIVVVIFCCVLFGELFLQVYFKVNNGIWLWQRDTFVVDYTVSTSDRRQYTLRPDFIDTQQGITINSLGFRGATVLHNDENQTLIVNLGDSVPFGVGVKDNETYSFYLQQQLKLNDITDVDVLNAGITSYNLRQSFDRLVVDVMEYYTPDIVTFSVANDINLLYNYKDSWTPDVTWADIRTSNSIFALQYYISRVFPGDTSKQQPNNDQLDSHVMLEYIQSELVPEILSFCESNDIKVVFIPINPFYYSTDTPKNDELSNWDLYRHYLELCTDAMIKYNEILYEASNKFSHVYYWNVCSFLDGYDREEMFIDIFHYSPKGNKVVGEGLLNFLKTVNILE